MAKLHFPVGKIHKKKFRILKKVGKAPGTITYMGNREDSISTLDVVAYGNEHVEQYSPVHVESLLDNRGEMIKWINLVGLSDEGFIEKLGKTFDLNPLVLEDAVHTEQRPKIDEYEHYIFGVFKMIYLDEQQNIVIEHVALSLFQHEVLVFQELKDDVFGSVRERILGKLGRIRLRGADYLFFALLDAIIDNYFLVLEHIQDQIEVLEEEVYRKPKPRTAQKIQELKKEVLRIRRFIFPVKELISRLIDSEHPLITKDTKLFLRDVLDHCLEINESLQIYREMVMSLMEMYMSNVSNKMNEVMKVLTVMASIFIPLTFIVGIYGMNFDNMPELHWQNGYYMVWGLMIFVLIVMLIYFRKRKWI
ncbi:magnesium transporter [Muriicola jejuensis]|uniref:Magnesium transport protein CorA n=1 Tax=Muriicola jejuensis TaxID=504488 RepID=A0A6P0ULW7_9FLAO|nr:magnesium/cobalt transporter CorA [Muriicola jejuensis]NER11246.1 magnesium/cobalt transporter CorA [Muriicola jejuensis]SMP21844.1 magnesium transporter [Muriicola jejuensis]